jgi:hypothetical protein
MSLEEQQNFLAKVYTDAEFRRAFFSNPEKIGAENDLNEREIAEISEVMPEELNFFADSLVWKRLREAEKFLPLTKRVLGREFTDHFNEFSGTFNPQTIQKHLEDAFEFCRFLEKQKLTELARTATKYERSKLEFFGFGKRFVCCKLGFDVREIDRSDAFQGSANPPAKTKFAVWLRWGKQTGHFFL